ncbi:hypothetical protein Dimus_010053 [Dionaea muscipula]
MASTSIPLNPPTASTITRNPHPSGRRRSSSFNNFNYTNFRNPLNNSFIRRTASSSSPSSSSVSEFDLYDLLGIDRSSDQLQIKAAYRALQKRCHPDIAGPAGHDMAIILNAAYAVLSDQNSRSVYDREQAKTAGLRGYTGKPIYSTWYGAESEQKAVFVDEVKCVGCLKCALLADKTFAIESVYGRARVVAQWADPEDKIQEAIDACPVNCISIIERSDLAALEFLMSKQPRGNVRNGVGNTLGPRVSDVFNDVEKFQRRFREAKKKDSSQHSKVSDLQRNRRISAIQAIRAISSWLYWQTPNSTTSTPEKTLFLPSRFTYEPNIDNLRNAAEARKHSVAGENRRVNTCRGGVDVSNPNQIYIEEYWIPSTHALPSRMNDNSTITEKPLNQVQVLSRRLEENVAQDDRVRSPLAWGIPIGTALIAAVAVGLNMGKSAVGGLEEHVAGPFALEIVNSSWLQIASAGAAWYAVGLVISEFLELLRGKGKE